MKNIVGSVATGKNYFARPKLTSKFWRHIINGDNLYLNAPRRSGKTSFMYELKENPIDGYECVYVNTEAVGDADQYFTKVLKTILECKSLNELELKQKSKGVFNRILEHFNSIEIAGVKLDINHPAQNSNTAQLLHDLLSKIDPEEVRIILLVDEFPTTVANIIKKHGADAAISFLQESRVIRQSSSKAVQFVCTGSIGLPALVSKLKSASSVNDLDTFDIPPFTNEEATYLVKTLLDTAQVKYQEALIAATLKEVKWLMPFFLQLVVSELIDHYEETQQTLDVRDAKNAIETCSSLRSNINFESYYNRIETSFSEEEAALALKILQKISLLDGISTALIRQDLNDIESKNLQNVLETLELDGYIHQFEQLYRFNSPILQRWWQRYT